MFLNSVPFNVLYLQETKLQEEDWAFIGRRLWQDGQFFVSPAALGVHAQRNAATTLGLGGVATAVSLTASTHDLLSL
jgi:hypothetical protein